MTNPRDLPSERFNFMPEHRFSIKNPGTSNARRFYDVSKKLLSRFADSRAQFENGRCGCGKSLQMLVTDAHNKLSIVRKHPDQCTISKGMQIHFSCDWDRGLRTYIVGCCVPQSVGEFQSRFGIEAEPVPVEDHDNVLRTFAYFAILDLCQRHEHPPEYLKEHHSNRLTGGKS